MPENRKYPDWLKQKLARYAESDMYMKRPMQTDVIGKLFGRLEVIRVVAHTMNGRALVLCHCSCGESDVYLIDALKGGTKSCGCLAAERQGAVSLQLHRATQRLRNAGKFTNLNQDPAVREPKQREVIDTRPIIAEAIAANVSQFVSAWSPPEPEEPELTFKEQWEKAQRESTAAKETEGSNVQGDNGNG